MRSLPVLPLALALALTLAGCGDDTPADGLPTDAPAPTQADTPAVPAASADLTGTAPAGSLGALTLRLAESDADGAPAVEAAAYLPAPVPDDAVPTFALVDAPSYHVGVDETALPDGFSLAGSYFLFVKRDADGALGKVSALRGWVGLSNSHSSGTMSGAVGGVTFAPLWPDGAPAPTLTYDTTGDDTAQLGTSPLAVTARPDWALPLTLPATVEDPTVTAELDIAGEDLRALGVRLYLLYRQADDATGEARWGLEDFRHDRSAARARRDDPAAPATVPYTVNPDDLASGPTDAYLLAFRE